MKNIIKKTLELIETSALYQSDMDENMATIYMWAHTALSPKCRKNHPEWTKDLMKELKKIK